MLYLDRLSHQLARIDRDDGPGLTKLFADDFIL
jgi:hypothetical protein